MSFIGGLVGLRRHVKWARDWVIPPLRYSNNSGNVITSTWGTHAPEKAENAENVELVDRMTSLTEHEELDSKTNMHKNRPADARIHPLGVTNGDPGSGDIETGSKSSREPPISTIPNEATNVHSNEFAKRRHLFQMNRGLSYRVGIVHYWMSEKGQHYLITAFQTLVLYSLSAATLLLFQSMSRFPGGQ